MHGVNLIRCYMGCGKCTKRPYEIIIENFIVAQVEKKTLTLLEHSKDGPLCDMNRRNAHFPN